MKTLVLFAATALTLAFTTPAFAADGGAPQLVASFMQAWDAGDAKALAALFAADADLVTPDGVVAQGRENIGKFYAYVFANGYAGSKGAAEIVQMRALGASLSIVDARWSIAGAHKGDGSQRPAEAGIMAAVLEKGADGWHIRALRENRGAADLKPFGP
ncbi:MAG TPA: SgcJ/EcaC family oxidoreductase [Rhizomicrobium sp.]|nr:SgcJ/EcaC family oxidoreductase [Rhizomicrobium sp.]